MRVTAKKNKRNQKRSLKTQQERNAKKIRSEHNEHKKGGYKYKKGKRVLSLRHKLKISKKMTGRNTGKNNANYKTGEHTKVVYKD